MLLGEFATSQERLNRLQMIVEREKLRQDAIIEQKRKFRETEARLSRPAPFMPERTGLDIVKRGLTEQPLTDRTNPGVIAQRALRFAASNPGRPNPDPVIQRFGQQLLSQESRDHPEYGDLGRTIVEGAPSSVSAAGFGQGDLPSFNEIMTPLVPPEALQKIRESVPYVGPATADIVGGLTSPFSLATLGAGTAVAGPGAVAKGLIGPTAGKGLLGPIGGGIALGSAGYALESAGVPSADTPIGPVGPAAIGETAAQFGAGKALVNAFGNRAIRPSIIEGGTPDHLNTARTAVEDYLKNLDLERPGVEAARTAERIDRTAQMRQMRDELIAQGVPVRDAIGQASAALGGRYTGFMADALRLTPEQQNALWMQEKVINAPEFQQKRLTVAWDKIDNGIRPAPNEIELIRDLMGPEIAQAIEKTPFTAPYTASDILLQNPAEPTQLGNRSTASPPKMAPEVGPPGTASWEQGNFPQETIRQEPYKPSPTPQGLLSWLTKGNDWWQALKTWRSSFDDSVAMRQLGVGGWSHPVRWFDAVKKSIGAQIDPDAGRGLLHDMQTDSRPIQVQTSAGVKDLTYGQVADEIMGIHSTDLKDYFGSDVARTLTGGEKGIVARSEVGFQVGQEVFRHDVGYDGLKNLTHNFTRPVSEKLLRDYGRLLNYMTGQGQIGQFRIGTVNVGRVLQELGWAPGYRVSGPKLLAQVLSPKTDNWVRMQGIKTIAGYLSGNLALLGLAKAAGMNVNTDPQSADFGKIVINNTSYSLWGTNQLLARSIVQAATGEGHKRPVTLPDGTVVTPTYKTDWKHVTERYLRSGADPLVANIWDLLDKKDFVGNKLTAKQFLKNQLPLFFSDMTAAMQAEGIGPQAAASGAISAFGGGVSSYGQSPNDVVGAMTKYQGLNLEQEQSVKELTKPYGFLDQKFNEYQRNYPGLTQSQFAQVWAATHTDQTNQLAAAIWKGDYPLNIDRITYAIKHQDELDAKELQYSIPRKIAVAPGMLTEENFKRYNGE